MTHRLLPPLFVLLLCFSQAHAQSGLTDSAKVIRLQEIKVIGYKTLNGIGHFAESQDQVLYSGKKTEVILVDSLDANKAINNTRQVLGRIPGLNIVESETGGFVANGFGIRGLNPAQSIEMNVRQNGYNLAADVYGYNETYYLPPMEAVERIELVKGAAGLQFGSQFGGMVNYVLKSPSPKPFSFTTVQTGASFGLFNSYNAVAGTVGKVTYLSYLQYRTLDGWRPYSNQQQLSGFGKVSFQASSRVSLSLEYSLLRNRIRMPGGLTDEQFAENSRNSYRSRNWLKSPWNILSATLTYQVSEQTSLKIQSTYLAGERSLVWFDEDPDELDLPGADGTFEDREVEREFVKSTTTEARLLTRYGWGNIKGTLAGGVRLAYSAFNRQEDGHGTNGSDFTLSVRPGSYEQLLDFGTLNVAPFLENTFKWGNRFSLTPGIRLEYLSSEIEGELEDESREEEAEIETEETRTRTFVLLGIGSQYQLGPSSQLYANWSQAYRPITYADLTPIGVSSQIDPNLRDAKGYTLDLGFRGTVKNILNVDIGAFYLLYNNRIGIVEQVLNGQSTTLRTNIAASTHAGLESYAEVNLFTWLLPHAKAGSLSLFNSLAYVHARYTAGPYKGNQVEYAPAVVNRVGLTYRYGGFSVTGQFSHQSQAFADASNAIQSENAVIGRLPAYEVVDLSATYTWKRFQLRAGINNLTDSRYFTQRTDEYPGPGIIPSIGRNGYVGVGFSLK